MDLPPSFLVECVRGHLSNTTTLGHGVHNVRLSSLELSLEVWCCLVCEEAG